jgi:hypothetical protein
LLRIRAFYLTKMGYVMNLEKTPSETKPENEIKQKNSDISENLKDGFYLDLYERVLGAKALLSALLLVAYKILMDKEAQASLWAKVFDGTAFLLCVPIYYYFKYQLKKLDCEKKDIESPHSKMQKSLLSHFIYHFYYISLSIVVDCLYTFGLSCLATIFPEEEQSLAQAAQFFHLFILFLGHLFSYLNTETDKNIISHVKNLQANNLTFIESKANGDSEINQKKNAAGSVLELSFIYPIRSYPDKKQSHSPAAKLRYLPPASQKKAIQSRVKENLPKVRRQSYRLLLWRFFMDFALAFGGASVISIVLKGFVCIFSGNAVFPLSSLQRHANYLPAGFFGGVRALLTHLKHNEIEEDFSKDFTKQA